MMFVAMAVKEPTTGLPGPAADRIFNTSDGTTRMTAYGPDGEPVIIPPGVALGLGPVVSVGRGAVGEGDSEVALGETEICVGEGSAGKVGDGVGVPSRDSEQPISGKSKIAASKASVVLFMVILRERLLRH
jgi:hypothetical protein